MSAVRLAVSELRRLTAGRAPTLVVLALAAVPLLYGGLYLYANADPYERLDRVPAALVVDDVGATQRDGTLMQAGARVGAELISDGTFDWRRTTAEAAEAGVRDGEFDFALRIPADFSASLISTTEAVESGGPPRQGTIVLTTNDANNYLVHTIAAQVATRVQESLSHEVGSRAAERFLLGFQHIYQRTSQAADGADTLAEGAGKAHDGAEKLADRSAKLAGGDHDLLAGARDLAAVAQAGGAGARGLATDADDLAGELGTLRTSSATLPDTARALADGAASVAAGAREAAVAAVALAGPDEATLSALDADAARLTALGVPADEAEAIGARLAEARTALAISRANTAALATRLDSLALGADQVDSDAAALATAVPGLTAGLGEAATGAAALTAGATRLADGSSSISDDAVALRDGIAASATGAAKIADGSADLEQGLGTLAGNARDLASGLRGGLAEIPNLDDATRTATAGTIADPVDVHTVRQNEAANYGAGLAPFFLSLAAWIGGYVLFLLVRPLSTRAMAANQSGLRVAVGGWLAPALLGAVQMGLLFAVVMLALRVDPVHPAGMAAFMMLASATFIAIIHMLNAWLGAVGQFLGLVLMVLQLVSAGGTFPWQTIPAPLHGLHHVLPMSYSVEGLRHLMYGGDAMAVGRAVSILTAYLLVALLLTALGARRHRVWTVARIKPEVVL
ncbi:YhgE/Pip domain-containing protein [Catenuloplanes atrovinosus]|uniref:Membrane protein n=1 Tax=Catenuloplanes atrovinosus TaxID=137266 RepID=A0AAE3YTH2_9ACTN|nr:YhgE/Pip domain-containing protein [Catenuloplanes atrovinosus]MDR7279574.1 putative membrane protein [Catenuloplanes atrovinosus]